MRFIEEWHVFRDSTGFAYEVVLHKPRPDPDFVQSGVYILYVSQLPPPQIPKPFKTNIPLPPQLFESNTFPPTYQVGARVVHDAITFAYWKPFQEPLTKEEALMTFKTFFHEKTRIKWDERLQRRDGPVSGQYLYGRTPCLYRVPAVGEVEGMVEGEMGEMRGGGKKARALRKPRATKKGKAVEARDDEEMEALEEPEQPEEPEVSQQMMMDEEEVMQWNNQAHW